MTPETIAKSAARPEGDPDRTAILLPDVPEEDSGEPRIPDVLPILPVRGTVAFPGALLPLTVRRPASLKLVDESLPQSKIIGILTQRLIDKEEPGPGDLYQVGTAGLVVKLLRQPDGAVVLVVRTLSRFRVRNIVQTQPFIRAAIEVIAMLPPPKDDKQTEAAVRNLRESAAKLIELTPNVPQEASMVLMNIQEPGQLADFVASSLSLEVADKQDLLEENDVVKLIRAVQQRVSTQLEIAKLQQKLQQDVASQFTDVQRRAYLREQLKAIQRELGEGESGADEQIEQLRRRLLDAKPPQAIVDQAERELKRLDIITPASPEFSVIAGYIETLAELPWTKVTQDALDLDQAQKILDRDHFDLEKVKRRLIEYLAVRKLNPDGHGPILCFVGPPGVGKTSLGQSIAEALGRKFARVSLGGMRDEAEIRGHRRTYIGSMPGRIIQELRRLGTRNPIIMLDEIDKLGIDFRGDPASALLEVLDPHQNRAFVDHYLDVPFDLSQILFIATANYMDPVPAALRDRMEVIDIPGYTELEKLAIATNYLVERQLKENGLLAAQCSWNSESLVRIISDYTHEAGVRDLERQIGAVCRGVAAEVARGRREQVVVTPALVQEMLGPPRFVRETRLKTSAPGIVTGLAYTPAGGEVLHIEATSYPGNGKVLLTGHIGEIMKESVQAALSLVRSRQKELGIPPDAFKDVDIHVHVPSGAVPKDGPSAGVAMFTAIASLFMKRPVRATVAMTGEITLRGLVLPIGGLKEKCLAAMRAGVEQVIIPKFNEKDLPELPEEVKRKLKITPVEDIDAVLAAALEEPPRKAEAPNPNVPQLPPSMAAPL
ncbi:MAG: endopeptidase La [Limisphaerales bacterium]